MNIRGLKVDRAEFNGHHTDIILRSENDNVRLYLKCNYADIGLTDKEFNLTLDEKQDKWGQDALHYAWALISQIATLVQASKEEIYRICLKDYAPSDIKVFTLTEYEEKKSEYKYHEVIGRKVAENTPLVVIQYWKGISQMNSHELNVFIEGVKSEAKEMGINTDTPSEIALYGGAI